MADPAVNGEAEEELVDYEEEEVAADAEAPAKGEPVKKGYVGIHSSGFKDFLLKPELIRAIVDCGFEHPSEGACEICRHPCPLRQCLCNLHVGRAYLLRVPRPLLTCGEPPRLPKHPPTPAS